MQAKVFRRCASFVIAGGLYTLLQHPASAAQLHLGWNYAIDSPNDSLGARPDASVQPGGSIYEIFGMAVKDDVATDSVWFAISANLPLYGDNLANPFLRAENAAGVVEQFEVLDSNIGWGDLFLDFSGTGSLRAASDASQLIGIKFSINNDSFVPTLGVYTNARGGSVTGTNAGYPNLVVNNATLGRRSVAETGQTRTASMGDLAWNDPYFAPDTNGRMPNVLASGTKIGEVTLLDRENLVKAGLDPDFFSPSGAEVFGFRLPKELLPIGEFIATLLTECINDGIALSSRLIAPPPPPPPTPYLCPITDGQRNALLPTQIIDGVKIFQDVPSGSWFDPPANMGFQFTTLDGSLFTGISGFPCAVAPETADIVTAPFNILVKDESGNYENIGQYFPGQSVDFSQINGSGGVSEFVITGIDPAGWDFVPPSNVPLAFKLLLNQPTVDFGFRRINDTTNLPVPERIIPRSGVPIETVPGYIFPEIRELPPIVGPPLEPPCVENGRCGAVPEPSTIAGVALTATGLLKLRRHRRQK